MVVLTQELFDVRCGRTARGEIIGRTVSSQNILTPLVTPVIPLSAVIPVLMSLGAYFFTEFYL